jgi:hypothetical protein
MISARVASFGYKFLNAWKTNVESSHQKNKVVIYEEDATFAS